MTSFKYWAIGLLLTLCGSTANADYFAGKLSDTAFGFQSTVGNKSWIGISPAISGRNVETDDLYQFFCSDINTSLSGNFYNWDVGQSYEPFTLVEAPRLSDVQKNSIQSLFNHVYMAFTQIRDEFDQPNWTTLQRDNFEIMATAFQSTVWEIVHETSDTWDISKGYFQWKNPARIGGVTTNLTPESIYDAVYDLSSSWFSGIKTGIWEEPFAKEAPVEVTFFFANGKINSQPLLGVNYHQPEVTKQNITPEPGTLLILGMGMISLPYILLKRMFR